MNRSDVLKLYDRFVGIIERLPGGLQKPILKELHPIRELFIEQRPPRILVVGDPGTGTTPAILHELAGSPVETGAAENGWRRYRIADRGAVEILDARADVPQSLVDAAVTAATADVIVLVQNCAGGENEVGDSVAAAVSRIESVRVVKGMGFVPVVALGVGGGTPEEVASRMESLLRVRARFVPTAVFGFDGTTREAVSEMICSGLPLPARLEFARFTMARGAQTEIAERLLKSFAALCGVIGVQPIPLADLPVLTALQSFMVSLIVYVSGRRVSPKLIAEFGAAVGLNVGAGFLFREGARAVVKFFPGWGNAVSGVVAGAGTYAIGRAAIAYFIEGKAGTKALQEIRKRFPMLNKPA